MCVCKKVLLGCTFIEIIFISDRALECFKPPDIFFFVVTYGLAVERCRQSVLELELETTLPALDKSLSQ